MATLGTFTSGQVLTAAELNAIGTWTDFTPTWTNLTVGDGTLTAQYCQINELVFWRVGLLFGSTTSISGTVQIDLPVAADDTWLGAVGGQCFYDDANGADYYGGLYRSSATKVTLIAYNAASTYVTNSSVNTSTPIAAWATGDRILIEDWYRPA